MLNGIGRVIEYKAVPGQTNQAQLVSVSEGVFKKGQLHGYARKLNKDGSCGVGFWQVQHATVSPSRVTSRFDGERAGLKVKAVSSAAGTATFDPRPYGKYAEYAPDGSMRKREGIYTTNERAGIQLVQACSIKDYLSNFDVDQLLLEMTRMQERPRFRN